MQKKSMEVSCYVCGAGAFGVFFRWLQDQLAFDDAGLNESSVFNLLVPLFIVVCAFLYLRFVDKTRNRRYYLPEDYCTALANSGKLFAIARWLFGMMMSVGGVMLFLACETDKEADFLRILSVFGVLSGVSFPLALGAANKEKITRPKLLCFLTLQPIILFAFWLVTCYKINSINSILWSYATEIITVILTMTAFFQVAGFSYSSARPWRAMFFSMLAASLCIMCLADSRYLGMQIMFLAAALMLVLYNWIMLKNLLQREANIFAPPDDGFEHLR